MTAIGAFTLGDEPAASGIVEELGALLEQDPRSQECWKLLFSACLRLGDFSTALSYVRGLAPRLAFPEDVLFPFGSALQEIGLHDAAAEVLEIIVEQQPDARDAHSKLLINKHLYGDDEDAFRESRRWNDRHIAPLSRHSRAAATSREADRPLRIGFVSNDFAGNESLTSVLAPWFLFKENRRDTYILYSNRKRTSPPHQLFLNGADDFIEVGNVDDEMLDQRIRKDRIDILVDFISHSEHNRLLTYARKPAPIIVSWVGLGVPTDIEAIDYFIADELLVPRDSIGHYREKIAYVPKAGMVWCPPRLAPPVGPMPSLKSGRVVFGNLTRVAKLLPETIRLWSTVLQRVPNSFLLLKDRRLFDMTGRHILATFDACGIGQEQLILRGGSDQIGHMETYSEIDFVLDCFPQNGGVSSLEAIWMGVPVISLFHATKPSARVGRMILENLVLPSLAVGSEEDYVALACMLAEIPSRFAPLRQQFRQRMGASPLCDVATFQHSIALLFRQIWKRYCDNLPPESLAV